MTAGGVRLRQGGPADAGTLLALFDDAVAWLNARGNTKQWGTEPFSARPRTVERAHAWAAGGGLWLAEDPEPAGAIVLGRAPDYVDPPDRPETYVEVLLTAPRRRGTGVGARLVEHAAALAAQAGAQRLRVDCWAGDPALPRHYERLGFTRAGEFTVGDWPGAVLVMDLA